MTDGDEVKLEDIKVGWLWSVLQKSWHIIILVMGLIWSIASYKSGLDNHMNMIDQHMIMQDQKLDWLIRHSPYRRDGEGEYQHIPPTEEQLFPQKGKPQSRRQQQDVFGDAYPQQESTLPPTFQR